MRDPLPAVDVTDARDDGGALVPAFYRTVLVPSFPADELDSEQHLIDSVREGRSSILIATDADGQIAGGAVGGHFPGANVMLLAYLAVRPGNRSGGVGSTLLRTAISRWTTEFDPRLLVLEAEDPRYFQGSPAFGDPVARVRFYERFGARALPLPYVMPALGPDTARVPRLMLLVIGGSAAPPDATHVSGTCVRDFLAEYFERCEGPARADDVELNRLLANADRPGGVPLLPVSDLPPFEERG